MKVITLTTDFGFESDYVGVMKGVILGICPEVQLVDISHQIRPQDICQGANVLWRAYRYFPKNTIHMAVVDPGVGTGRRPILVRAGDQFFVGPDNGVFTLVYDDTENASLPIDYIHLTQEKYWLRRVSRTFHGRDIFAPVAAYLASGVSMNKLGEQIHDPVRIDFPKPEKTTGGWIAHITGIDNFGNLITDLPLEWILRPEKITIRLGHWETRTIRHTYGEAPVDSLVALGDSHGLLELAIVNGNAAEATGATIGDMVEVVE